MYMCIMYVIVVLCIDSGGEIFALAVDREGTLDFHEHLAAILLWGEGEEVGSEPLGSAVVIIARLIR